MTAPALVRRLTEKGQTLGVAESLTGGLLCDAIVQVPGASKVFMGGIVAYDEGRKAALLGVSPQTLAAHTAVSRETALEMAQGARRALNVDFALATTGYAGPDGDDVGLVYVARADASGAVAQEHRFTGTREEIRRQAVRAALELMEIGEGKRAFF